MSVALNPRRRRSRVFTRPLTDAEVRGMLSTAGPALWQSSVFAPAEAVVVNTPDKFRRRSNQLDNLAAGAASANEFLRFIATVEGDWRAGELDAVEASALETDARWFAKLAAAEQEDAEMTAEAKRVVAARAAGFPPGYFDEVSPPAELERLRRDLLRPLPRPKKNPKGAAMYGYAFNPPWVPTNYGDDSRKRARKRKRRGRLPPRRADGTFVKRSRGKKRRAARPATRRASAKKRRLALPPRGRGGRFLKRRSRKTRAVARRKRPFFLNRKRSRRSRRYVVRGGRRQWAALLAPRSVRTQRRRTVKSLFTPGYTRRQKRHNKRRRRIHRRGLVAVKTIKKGRAIGGLVRLNPRTGELIMSRALVANPRRRRRRRRSYVSNPRRRRRSRRRMRVARNPGVGSIMTRAKRAIAPGVAGMAGGALAGFVDTLSPLANRPIVSGLAKLALAAVGAGFLRNRSELAYGFVGGAMGNIGYAVGLRMGGGLVAKSKGQAAKGMADLAAEDPELQALLADAGIGDLGDLVAAGDLADGELEGDEDMADLVVD